MEKKWGLHVPGKTLPGPCPEASSYLSSEPGTRKINGITSSDPSSCSLDQKPGLLGRAMGVVGDTRHKVVHGLCAHHRGSSWMRPRYLQAEQRGRSVGWASIPLPIDPTACFLLPCMSCANGWEAEKNSNRLSESNDSLKALLTFPTASPALGPSGLELQLSVTFLDSHELW